MAETHHTHFPVIFSNLNLDELSKELDRRTKETQMLQEEVERATKQALERAGLNITLPQSCLTTMFEMDDSVIQPLDYDQDDLSSEVTRRSLSFREEEGVSSVKEVLENPVEEHSKELSQLHKQLEETLARYEHLKFHFLQTVVRLQTELQEVQAERDVLSDLRMKDFGEHADQMDRMRGGLQSIGWSDSGDHQRLRETELEARSLGRSSEVVEQTFKQVYADLVAHEKQTGLSDSVTSLDHAAASPGDDTASSLRPSQFPPEVKAKKAVEQLGSEELKYQGKATLMLLEQKDRMVQLIASHDQEVVMLTDKLTSSRNSNASLHAQLGQLQNQAESQASLHECQVTELESALSLYKDKVCSVERHLSQTQSQMDEAFMRQAERLESQRTQITSELRQTHEELSQEKERSEQLEVRCAGLSATVEELHKELDERSLLVQQLGTFREDCQAQMETLGRASLEEAQGRCRALQAEADGLRLQLGDSEKALELLRLQTESDVQTTVQHGRIIDTLHQEKNHLTNQLNEHKLEVQQLRAELAERDSGLAALEQDRQELQASLAEQRRRFQQATLEKRQLAAQVNAQRTQLLLLSEGHKGAVIKLRSQLKSTHAELEQAKRSLRTLEGADGHGLQVAMGMQKRITAGREQMDSLQGRIQQQEAAMEELYQEKHCQDLESQRQVQMLLSLREDKRRLAEELLALRSNERRLQDRVSGLEAALHKMSESFADCQDVIHLQEQEFIRLKLQHALDLKERQGQDSRSAATAVPSVSPPMPPALAAIPPSPSTRQASRNLRELKAQKLQERLTQEPRPQVKELRGSFSEKCRPHTSSTATGSLLRRGSTPERAHRTTPELHLQRTSDLNHHNLNSAIITGTPLGRRSPVHSLLTSVPDLKLLRHRPEPIKIPTCKLLLLLYVSLY